MGTILVLSSLIVVCGFIAYTGDLLGRRLGKRRLSAFGLRPRYTAILCTVITGMVIAGITLAVLVGVSAGVRRAVLQGEALLHQNQQYQRERYALRQETDLLRNEVEPLRRQNQALTGDNLRIESANADLVRKNDALTAGLETLHVSEASLRVKNRTLGAANGDAKRRLRDTRVKMQAAQAELDTVRRRLTATSRALTKNRQYLEANQRLMEDNLEEARRLEGRMRDLRSKVDVLALSDVIVRDGEELARIIVPAGAPNHEAQAQVQELMARARQTARERGAQRKGPHLEAYLYSDRLARMMGQTQAWPNVPQRDLLPVIVDLVAGSRDDVVLRALAIQNTAAREPVPFDIRMFWNQHAFSKGEEIASTVINPRQTRGEILEDLAAWLRTKVREVSINRRVIPGPRNEVGEVGYDLLLEVVDKIQRLSGPAKVGAVAARDVRSADPLAIDIYVVPAETPVASRTTPIADEKR